MSYFTGRKSRILAQLAVPDEQYSDLSPKGCVDEPIRKLIADINNQEGMVTTSSCSGRISVFHEGRKAPTNTKREDESSELANSSSFASAGGKGGGNWLFVSHDPVTIPSEGVDAYLTPLFGLKKSKMDVFAGHDAQRFVHFKFEAMILHILTASHEHAQKVLSAALNAGFRESGAVSLTSSAQVEACPIVAVRSAGLGMDSIIGYTDQSGDVCSLVDEAHLALLVKVANQRFTTNIDRIKRFHESLKASHADSHMPLIKSGYEDADARRERKKREGLERQRALMQDEPTQDKDSDPGLGSLDMFQSNR